MKKVLFNVSGEYFLKEPDNQGNAVSISQLNETMVKEGMSARYEKVQSGKMVPVQVQFYKNGIDCGVLYSFDSMTGVFTTFVEYSKVSVCISMDRFAIKKYKNVADAYYKQAQDMLDILRNKNKRIYVR